MNVALWVVAIALGLAFALAGAAKSTQSKEQLHEKMPWVEDVSPAQLRLIGIVEALGGLGLILPAWTGIAPMLTPLAASGIALIMAFAAAVHVRRKEYAALPINAVLFLLAVFVAWGRFGPYSY
ncbi:DoxX family protein [Nocardia sp. SYP-A9097]|uniref:DoxX family protein n=1 Tax=Nocardia sp. SYP-A9097 TaxID=2663237 RepID=UPI00129A3174|nr:DoxX family protein [Nocardia sp. SYP-A9097]MRH87519.1 DoxX family protein [Nocardia sp. SYP-A9097]